MLEVKDSGKGLYVSRLRIVGLVFGIIASPVFFVCASLGHPGLGMFLYLSTGIGLTIAYQMTPLGKFMRGLIPTSAEKTEGSHLDQN